METIYDILSQEHKLVLGMFEAAMASGSKEALFKIKVEIDPHMAGEEKLYYPLLEEKEESRDIARKAYMEHNEAKALMYELEGMGESSENWTARLNELKEVIIHHVQDEESKVFEKSRNILSQRQAEELAQKYLEFKKSYTGKIEAGESLA
ncbi:hemerythrin domain-containing protein [Methanosarcina sp.]|uniref:hemerythrin domain-containing protein n=1 Tax=Methanosarcina sp. TaxID=2213 RepID=UPI003C76E54F